MSRSNMFFVLLESEQSAPIGVFKKAEKPYLLPADAVETHVTKSEHYVHREIVGQWFSESFNRKYTLVAYVLQ